FVRDIPVLVLQPEPPSTLFPYTTLFRSELRSATGCFETVLFALLHARVAREETGLLDGILQFLIGLHQRAGDAVADCASLARVRSEEHTSELQSRFDLVCRLLLEKKKNQ